MSNFIIGANISPENFPYDPRCSIPKGARVEKTNSNEKDYHPNGSRGYTYGGSVVNGKEKYLVKWDIQKKLKVQTSVPITDTFVLIDGYQLKQINNKAT